MEEQEKNVIKNQDMAFLQSDKQPDDREAISRLLFLETEEKTKEAVTAKQRFNTETRQLISGDTFTIEALQQEYKKYIIDIEKDYEPKFTLFLTRLGILCQWNDEEKARFRKPKIAAITIIQTVYLRFPDGLLNYIQTSNKYVGYCIRRTKNYMLLNEEGIRLLEEYIDDANVLMPQCRTYYEFRKKMFQLFKVPYQMSLFPDLN